MKHLALTSALLLGFFTFATTASAQATKKSAKKDVVPATTTATAAPAPPSPELLRARMRPALKGTADIEFIVGAGKKVGNGYEMPVKVKNMSDAPIVGLRIDSYFYLNGKEAGAGEGRLRTALAPGEEATIMTESNYVAGAQSQMRFSHANGSVNPKQVKKFSAKK